MLTHWIWFAHRPGVSDRLKAVLMEHFCDPEDIFYADEAALRGLPELTREALEGLLDKNLTSSEEILESCDRKQLHILTYQDAGYPARLKNIPDPPMVLYYKGRLPEFDAYPTIGIVGTRKASAYGLTAAKRLGYQIGKRKGDEADRIWQAVVNELAESEDAHKVNALSVESNIHGLIDTLDVFDKEETPEEPAEAAAAPESEE